MRRRRICAAAAVVDTCATFKYLGLAHRGCRAAVGGAFTCMAHTGDAIRLRRVGAIGWRIAKRSVTARAVAASEHARRGAKYEKLKREVAIVHGGVSWFARLVPNPNYSGYRWAARRYAISTAHRRHPSPSVPRNAKKTATTWIIPY